MNQFTVSQISEITAGKLITGRYSPEVKISRIVTDSRAFFKGDQSIFFALTGTRNNGHNYIPELIEKGIKVFVVSESGNITDDASFILVDDTKKALQQLALFNRSQFKFPVIGITGSNGKTIIKEWLYDLLSTEYNIIRSPKSYNSQIGVPLSVFLMEKKYDLGIFEAGISMPGEMQNLAEIIDPQVGVFTNIGDAHQENFDSYIQKINEKLALFKSAKKLVYCVDDRVLEVNVSEFCRQNRIEELSWSLENGKAFVQFSSRKYADHTTLSAKVNHEEYFFEIPFTDESAIENACHCFVVIFALSKKPEKILSGFKTLDSVAMRLEIKKGINDCILINDYYNSDLNSLSIALTVLQQQAAKANLHKVVILSDIQQTGVEGKELYGHVNKLLSEWGIDELVGIGTEISAHSELFTIEKRFFLRSEDFVTDFRKDKFKRAVVLIKGARNFTFEKISELIQQKAHQTILEINLNAMVNNLNVFRSLLRPESKIMVMVKAFSYGIGDVEIAKMLQFQNVDYLAVAVADEGVQLRESGINIPIIVMNPEEHSFQNLIDYRLEPNIYSLELLKTFEKIVSQNALDEYPVHLKLDTGMNRLGFKSSREISDAVFIISSGNELKIKSVFSHLAASDDSEMDYFTTQQIVTFEKLFAGIAKSFSYKIDRHILNSAGIERFFSYQFEMVRLGIGLYGITQTGLPLENIGTFKSKVSQVKEVKAKETIGYNRKGELQRDSRIAVVPVGYADGLDRKLGNKNGNAYINGERVPIIGNICMDMLMLDVTDVEVQSGDEVEFFGNNISVSEVAEKAGTIPYEILTGISQRVKRVYIQE